MRPARPGTGWRASSQSVGVECVVAAPSKIPRATGDRVKTDRRDAEHLVRLLLAGKLHAVRVPGTRRRRCATWSALVRRFAVDLMRARHRLSKLLLRHGIRFDEGRAWTDRHRAWLATVALEWPAAQATLLDLQGAIDALAAPPRAARARDRRVAPGLAMGGAGRAVAVPARDRHANRGRVVRGDRRLRAVRPGRAADELHRAGPVRDTRPGSSAGSGRSPRPDPGTPAGCWSRPPGTSAPRGALLYPRRSRDELEGRFVGLMANPDPRGERNNRMPAKRRPAQVSGLGCRGTRVIWRKLDCLNPNLQMTQRRVRRNDTRYRRHALRRPGSAAVATFGAWSVAQ